MCCDAWRQYLYWWISSLKNHFVCFPVGHSPCCNVSQLGPAKRLPDTITIPVIHERSKGLFSRGRGGLEAEAGWLLLRQSVHEALPGIETRITEDLSRVECAAKITAWARTLQELQISWAGPCDIIIWVICCWFIVILVQINDCLSTGCVIPMLLNTPLLYKEQGVSLSQTSKADCEGGGRLLLILQLIQLHRGGKQWGNTGPDFELFSSQMLLLQLQVHLLVISSTANHGYELDPLPSGKWDIRKGESRRWWVEETVSNHLPISSTTLPCETTRKSEKKKINKKVFHCLCPSSQCFFFPWCLQKTSTTVLDVGYRQQTKNNDRESMRNLHFMCQTHWLLSATFLKRKVFY